MEVKATVKLTAKELYGFLMHNTYSTFGSYIGVFISIGSIVGFFYMLGMPDVNPAFLVALLVIGLLFTVVQPLMLYSKAKKQVKVNEAINASLEYKIDKKGIKVSQGEQSVFTTWDEIVKVTSTKKLVMLYTSRVNAYVIPKNDLKDGLLELKKLIQENCDAGYIKLWK